MSKSNKLIQRFIDDLNNADWNNEEINDTQVLQRGSVKERRLMGEEYWQIQAILTFKEKFQLTNKQVIDIFKIPKDRLRDRMKMAHQDFETIPELMDALHEEMEELNG